MFKTHKGGHMKVFLLGVMIALVGGHFVGTAMAQSVALDDWKTRICVDSYENKCSRHLNVYLKELSPKKGVTCFVVTGENSLSPADTASISCLKD